MNNLLLIDDDADLREALTQSLELEGFSTSTYATATTALRHLYANWPGAVICDLRMPEMDGLEFLNAVQAIDAELPVVLITGHGDVSTAIRAIRAGAYDLIEKPFRNAVLYEVTRRALEKRRLVLENRRLQEKLAVNQSQPVIGRSAPIEKLRVHSARLASAGVDVLIQGETGTGRELIAREMHRCGPLQVGPFVSFNCAAVSPADHMEQLFGGTGEHDRRPGKFELAHRGTLFIDSIDTLNDATASQLLATLQQRQIATADTSAALDLDLRVVAASRTDLQLLCEDGRFRADLYYHLNAAKLVIPPLRERREDILPLFQHYLQIACERYDRELPVADEGLIDQLLQHDWPGNERELKSTAERLALGADPYPLHDANPNDTVDSLPQRVEQFEKLLIEQALEKHVGNAQQTARSLCVPRKTFYDKIKKYHIDINRYRRQ